MFCPRCGEERVSQATRFCSRCGFLLTGAAELIEKGGAPLEGLISPRARGIRLGLFMLLLTIVVAPIMGMISAFGFGIVPWPMGITIFLLGGGGLLRIAYAMMFESNKPSVAADEWWPKAMGSSADTVDERQLSGSGSKGELNPSSFVSPRSNQWLDTNDLEPTSVTDHTTKLLEKDS